MIKLIQKDKHNRNVVKLYEAKKFILKSIFHNTNFSKLSRWKISNEITNLPIASSVTHINNRCVFTGRKKRINALYSFSRISFLKLARAGNINGLKKSSW